MYDKFNRSEIFNKDIFTKLKNKRMPMISEIKDALKDKDREFISLSYTNKNKNKNNKIKYKERRILHIEEKKFIDNYNKKLEHNLSNYNRIKKDNMFFKNSFENLKKLRQKTSSNKQEKYNYMLGGLLKKYIEKGLMIPKNSIDKDIFKESSLLTNNNNLDKFYKYDLIINKQDKDKRANKNINFLKKLKTQAYKKYQKTLLKAQKKEENDIFINVHQRKKFNPLSLIKNKSQDLFGFIDNYTSKDDIQKEKREIKKIKNLILEEEKQLYLKRNKLQKINNINDSKNEDENNSFILRINRGKTRTINPIMASKFNRSENKINKNRFNNQIILEYNNLNNKNIIQSKSQLNNINSIHSSSTNSTNININNNDIENKEKKLYYIYNQLSLYNYMDKRQSSINSINKINQLTYSNYLASKNSIFINLRKKRKTNLDIYLNSALSVNDAYDKVANLDFISYKENSEKKRIKVDNLLKKYYGKKYQEYNKKNNHINILENCQKIKDKIINSELKNTFIKYKKELPKLLQNKIELNLKLNKKLKNYGNKFIFSFYEKKLDV